RAENATALVMQPDESVGGAIDHGSVNLTERHGDGPRVAARGFLRRPAYMRELRVCERAPRNDQIAELAASEEQRVLHDDASHRIGGVRELKRTCLAEARAQRRAADVTRSVDTRIGRAQPIVDLN